MGVELVVIGTSAGGMRALAAVLGALPAEFPAAVVMVLHRAKDSDASVADMLQRQSALPLREAEDKMAITGGQAYLAPADYHLLIDGWHFALSTEAPVHHARPSIDVLFESAAAACAEMTAGVILTGGSEDGAAGLAAIKAAGGLAVVQDPETAENRVMPDAAIAATAVDQVLPLERIGPFLAALACAVQKDPAAAAPRGQE